jgi:small ligand-binding sensory domain FIST
MLVTQVEGQLVHALGQRKPMEVMQELHAGLDPSDRALFERAVFLGVEMRDQVEYGPGDFLIRNVLGIEPRSGALAVDARLDPWKAVQFHLRDAAASREDLRACLDRAGADGFAPTAALLFSCLGRGEGLYGEPSHDTRAVRERFGDIPVGGFFCNGEIGRVGDRTYLHGYTSTLVLLEPSP